MSQRRMPSGQGPARGTGRPSVAPRPGSRRSTQSARRSLRYDGPWRQPSTVRRAAVETSRHDARPGGIRRAAGPARRTKAPRRPRRVSGRAAALTLLLLALTLAYAYPVRVYLAQQGEIDQLESSQAEQRRRIQELKDQLARWDDPNYVITQARSRLHMVRPGELLFVVEADQEANGPDDEPADASWSSKLWANLQAADNP